MRVGLNLSNRTSLSFAILGERLDVPLTETIRGAMSLYWWVAKERSTGARVLIQRGDKVTELVISSLDRLDGGPPLEDPPR
jgi:hypothetical protein